MRNFFISTFFIFSFFSLSAQTAADFTITDVDGISRNLYTELDAGNVVVLKFFTSWCSICNGTAAQVVSIYNAYQSNNDPVVFWALDRDPNETNTHAINYRNSHNIPFPVIGEAYAIAQQFGVVYQPEYYIIRPNRSYVKKTNYTSMNTAVDEALASIPNGVQEAIDQNSLTIHGNKFQWNTSSARTASLRIFDIGGRELNRLELSGDASLKVNLNTGIYLYQLEEGETIIARGKFAFVGL